MTRLLTGATLAVSFLILAITIYSGTQLAQLSAQLDVLVSQVEANTKAIYSLDHRVTELESVTDDR